MYVTFCGHRNVDHPEQVAQWLHQVVTALIEEGNEQFYLGGYGEFDQMAAREVQRQKQRHPQVRSIFVPPYLSKEVPIGLYDEIVYPRWKPYRPSWPFSGGSNGWWSTPKPSWPMSFMTGAGRRRPCSMPKKRKSASSAILS